MVHASTLLPFLGYWVVAMYCIKMFFTIITSNHVDEIIQGTQTMISSGCDVSVDRTEPSVCPRNKSYLVNVKINVFIVVKFIIHGPQPKGY
jgi:hypothetical protein